LDLHLSKFALIFAQGCFEYREHGFTMDFGALHAKWCPIKACKFGSDCQRLGCDFWHPAGSRHAELAELHTLDDSITEKTASLTEMARMGVGEERLVGLRTELEAQVARRMRLWQQLH
jgi:hypothetical protein